MEPEYNMRIMNRYMIFLCPAKIKNPITLVISALSNIKLLIYDKRTDTYNTVLNRNKTWIH